MSFATDPGVRGRRSGDPGFRAAGASGEHDARDAPLNSAQPTANPDGDFNDNRTEFLVGTNPNSASEAWTYFVTTSGGSVTLTFPRVANRRFQVQVSTDLQTWSLWDVPANAPSYSATSFMDTMMGPAAGAPQFFRFEIDLP